MRTGSIESSLGSLLKSTKEFYQERLLSFAIFGSFARNTATENSDLDILLIIENLPAGRFARVDEWVEVEKVWTEKIFLSPVFFTLEELKQGSPLFLDMTEGEAIILYDPKNTLTEYLFDLKRRLKEMGSKKINQGKSSYWIMGPKTGREVVL